jgi:hypothetical protein
MENKMTKRLDYVASGTAYMRLHRQGNIDTPEIFEYICSAFTRLQDRSSHHKFGLLFNAFMESSFGEKFEHYKPHLGDIHADSGGLQIVTQGKVITSDMKDQIYRVQAKWADLGMSFDEIPIGTMGSSSSRNDVSNRWFKPDEMEHYARESGRNIKRQIEVFHEEGSACKPILIAQGNCYDTYMKWVDYLMQEIPASEHKYIGGVAMGAAALGTGTLEDIERAFIFSQLPVERSHLHVLGVGAAKRLLPYIVFLQNGMYDGVTMSYDSTTHTGGSELGLFYQNTRETLSFNRQFGKDYETIYNDMAELGLPEGVDLRGFHEIMNTGFTKYVEDLGKSDVKYMQTRTAFTIKSILNFVQHVDDLYDSKKEVLKLATDAKIQNPIKHLYDVKTKSDWDSWLRHFKKAVKSNRVQVGQPAALEEYSETKKIVKPPKSQSDPHPLDDFFG